MRTIIFLIVFFFSYCTVSGQYTWNQKGTKTLIGKERKYFGTETGPEELKKIACGCEPHADYSNQGLKKLGNLSPDMGENGKGLFWNFDKQGRAHLTELEGLDKVFLKGNCVYAHACGNLLKQEELETKSPAPEKGSWKPYNPQKEKQVFVPVEQNYIVIKQMKKHCWMKKSYGYPQSVECHGGGTTTGVVKTILEEDKYQFLDQTEIISRGSGRWTEVFWQIQ